MPRRGLSPHAVGAESNVGADPWVCPRSAMRITNVSRYWLRPWRGLACPPPNFAAVNM